MNEALAIKYLYPNTELGEDYLVRDDGKGQFIDKWALDDPIPSDEVLEVAWNEYLAKNGEKPISNVERQLLLLGEQLALASFYCIDQPRTYHVGQICFADQ